MITIKVRLSLLDRLLAEGRTIAYDDVFRVAIACNEYEIIGKGTVYKNPDGTHFGILYVEKEPNGDLYYYYNNLISEQPTFWFNGIELREKENPRSPTTQFKDMIIG